MNIDNGVILSATKWSRRISICALFALLALTACDDSTSATPSSDPVAEVSSSSDTLSPSTSSGQAPLSAESNGSSGGSLTSAGSENSSSSEKNAKESSSSATTKNSSSSVSGDQNSSSSAKKEDSSSSVVKVSSSSATQKSSSSEEVKQSSSSIVASSSSFDINAPCKYGDIYIEEVDGKKVGYICYTDGWTLYVPKSSSSVARSSSSRSAVYYPIPSPLKNDMSYGEYTDPRDGQKYATIDIDNKYGPDSLHIAFTVFAQNLKYHEKITLGANEQDDDTKVEMYCYKDTVAYCNDWWGGLYQWAEMMDLPYECNSKSCAELIDPDGDGFHQGICPDDWHVMTEREVLAMSYTAGESYDRFYTMMSVGTFSGLSENNNLSGASFIAAGFREDEIAGYKGLWENSYTWIPKVIKKDYFGSVLGLGRYPIIGSMDKTDGASGRCVKDY